MDTQTVQATIERVKQALLAMQRHSWEQGVAAQAFLELGDTRTVVLMAKEAVVRQQADGRVAVVGSNHAVTDPCANGEPLFYAARVTGDPVLQQAADALLHYLLVDAPRTADGTLHHLTTKPQLWSDSIYMGPPFLAAAGRQREAVQQVEGLRKHLWSEEKHLFSNIWDESTQDFPRKDFWGVGNGWAAAGMARVIRALPADMEHEGNRLARYVREVIDGCLAYQRSDGLFHDVVDDADSFVETNLAQMLAYTIFRGVKGKWLDAFYLGAAGRMRQAAHAKVDEWGLVQGVCGAPTFDHPGTAPEGQAFFLLMEAAAQDMEGM